MWTGRRSVVGVMGVDGMTVSRYSCTTYINILLKKYGTQPLHPLSMFKVPPQRLVNQRFIYGTVLSSLSPWFGLGRNY